MEPEDQSAENCFMQRELIEGMAKAREACLLAACARALASCDARVGGMHRARKREMILQGYGGGSWRQETKLGKG